MRRFAEIHSTTFDLARLAGIDPRDLEPMGLQPAPCLPPDTVRGGMRMLWWSVFRDKG
jgi:hypothetical protein